MNDFDAIAVPKLVPCMCASRHDLAIDLDCDALAAVPGDLEQAEDMLILGDFADLAIERDFHSRILTFMAGQQHRRRAQKKTPQGTAASEKCGSS